MALCKRVIARLDVKGKKIIKGRRFEGLRVVGDATELTTKYADSQIDEIFYADAVASLYQRNGLADLLKKASKNIFVPITAGGAIRSVEDARLLLNAGADKIAINTAAVKNPSLINEIAKTFGNQCIVISIQARKSFSSNDWDVMIESGRERSSRNLKDWIVEVQQRGAGEIFLTSVDNDGTGFGPDIDLIKSISPYVSIPLIIGGGISKSVHIRNIFKINNKISGIAIGYGLHQNLLSIYKAKDVIKSENFPMRIVSKNKTKIINNKIKVAVVDYSMGNIESLCNALAAIGAEIQLSSEPEVIQKADALALPGVGSFPEGMRKLKSKNLIDPILRRAKQGGLIIGICLGMQLLFEEGEEHKQCKGLGILKGKVCKLPTTSSQGHSLTLPHVGWNEVKINDKFKDEFIDFREDFHQYFTHSFAALKNSESDEDTLFESDFGGHKFISAIKKDNIIGLQFHPERSGEKGLELLSKIINYDNIENNLIHQSKS